MWFVGLCVFGWGRLSFLFFVSIVGGGLLMVMFFLFFFDCSVWRKV